MVGIHGWSAFRKAGLAATALIGCWCAPAHAAARPDLLPTKLTYPAGTAQPGAVYTTRATIENAGSAKAGRSTTVFYLSLDAKRSSGDVRLGGVAIKSLAAGHGVRITKRFSMPANMPPGTYRMLVCADDTHRVKESHEGNDCLASKPALTVRAKAQAQPPAQASVHLDPPPPEEQATPPPLTTAQAAPAAVSLNAPLDGAFVRSGAITLSGTASTHSLVTIEVFAGSSAAGAPAETLQALPAPDGTWTAQPSTALPDGAYTVRAGAMGPLGDVALSTVHTFTVDTVAPAVSVTLDPATPDGSGGTYTAMPAVHAVASDAGLQSFACTVDGAPAPLSNGAQTAGDLTVSGEGAHTVSCAAADQAGWTAGTTRSFTVQSVAPVVSLVQPADGLSTGDSTPAFDGAAGTARNDLPAVTVPIYRGSSATGTPVVTLTTTASGGTWSATPTAGLADGTYTALAKQSNAAGDLGSSAAHTFTVDTTPPSPAVAHPAAGAAVNSATATIDGTAGTAAGDTASVTVSVYAGTAATGSPIRTMTAPVSGGTWSATPAALADGGYTVQVTQSDAAGNTGTSSARTFTVDTSAPAVALDHPADGSPTADTTPSFDGTAGTASGDGPTVTVRIYSGTAAAGTPLRTLTATPGAGGAWSGAPSSALAEGVYTAQAQQTDSAGNTGHSAARTFTVDTTAPTVALAHPAAGSLTSSTTPAFDGTASSAADDSATVTVKIYSGSSATGTPGRTLTTTASGGSWSATPGSALADGTYTAQAEQADAAGNTGKSAARTFTIDSTAPAVTLTSPADGSVSGSARPSFAGAAGTAAGDSSTVSVRIYSGSSASGTPAQTLTTTASGGTWSATAGSNLADGTYTAQAEQSDTAGNTGTSAARTFRVDTTAPVVSIAHPTAGSTSNDQYPTFDGTASTGSGTATTVTVKAYAGGSVAGSPVQTLSATRGSTGAWSVQASAALPNGAYTVQAEQSTALGAMGQSQPVTFNSPAVLMAAGDIAGCGSSQTGDTATASLLNANPSDAIAALGDNAYESGSATEFANCYGPTWGAPAIKAKTHPAAGNHDYYDNTADARDYFNYFGAAAGTLGQGWYSYDLAGWHVVVLNSNDGCTIVSCSVGSAQEKWLKADLAAHTNQCTLAYWHHPRFSSGANGGTVMVQAFWTDLYNAGADVVLNGHDHDYERFAPQDPSANADSARGIREFVVGTGGYTEYEFGTSFLANSQVRNANTHGVLQLVLRPSGYSWTFLPEAGRTFTDSGSAPCH